MVHYSNETIQKKRIEITHEILKFVSPESMHLYTFLHQRLLRFIKCVYIFDQKLPPTQISDAQYVQGACDIKLCGEDGWSSLVLQGPEQGEGGVGDHESAELVLDVATQ